MKAAQLPCLNVKTILLFLFLPGTVLSAVAGISSGLIGGPMVVLAERTPKNVAVSLTIPADFVSVPVRLTSEQRNTAAAYEETRQALELITRKARESGLFQTSMGVVSLSQDRRGYGLSSGSWNQPAASAEVCLLVPLSTNITNIFTAGVEAARFIEALSLPGKTKCELGTLQLAVANPEQYRPKVLGLILDEIKKTRETMAPQGGVKVTGLESPVFVQQVDDRHVSLFMNYSFSVSEDK